MKTRMLSILFKGEMVRAIREGHKTQTRRVVKLFPGNHADKAGCVRFDEKEGWLQYAAGGVWVPFPKCPYGQPGDRLLVRETWRCLNWIDTEEDRTGLQIIEYRADGQQLYKKFPLGKKARPTFDRGGKRSWRPSIFMPRWASRLAPVVTDVRVERVQDISDQDARAEGVDPISSSSIPEVATEDHIKPFSWLWDSIAKPGEKWADSPWVWAVTLKMEK